MGTKAVSWTEVSPGWDLVILEGIYPQVLLNMKPPDLLVYVENIPHPSDPAPVATRHARAESIDPLDPEPNVEQHDSGRTILFNR